MRILITGGLGFVGGRLASYLQKVGHQVVIGSRTSYGPPDWLAQAEMIQLDWNDGLALKKICAGVDVVIHAAGMNAQDCAADPVGALAFNGLATAKLVEAAIRADVLRFLYLSSAHVYANTLFGNITEELCPRNLHPYATSHLAGENAVLSARQLRLIEGIVLRLSNAFGTPMHKDVNCWMLLVNDLCCQAVMSRKLVLRSSGLQVRDFITLTDVVRAVAHLLDNTTLFYGEGIFNLGGEFALSVWQMTCKIAERCQYALGYMPEIVRLEPNVSDTVDPLYYRVDRLKSTGFKLLKQLDDEIDTMLLFCRASFGISNE